MILAALSLAVGAASAPVTLAPVTLERKFIANQVSDYAVRAHLQVEQRTANLFTWMPEDVDLQYDFQTKVQNVRPDGEADMAYARPTFTIIEGETADSGPKTKVEKVNMKANLRLSVINEILNVKDLTPAKFTMPTARVRGGLQGDPITSFISDVQRLGLFMGSFDSALDFNPKLPLDEVNVGDTWKKTVGFQPQKRSDTGKQAVQRLDYVFTYKGPSTYNGKPTQRVDASLTLDTDLVQFLKDSGVDPDDLEELKSWPLKLDATIRFELEPGSLRTLYAEATSNGGFQIIGTEDPDHALLEQRFKGKTFLKLRPPVAKAVPKR